MLVDRTALHIAGTVSQYAPLVAAGAISMLSFKLDFRSPYFLAIITYILLVTVSILGPGEIVNLRDPAILLLSLAILNSATTITRKDFDYITAILCTGFVITSFFKHGFPAELDVIRGISPWEHHRLSYVFSVFVIYYFAQKRWIAFALVSLVFILSMKRIAIFGCGIGALIWLTPDFLTRSKRLRGILLTSALLSIGVVALNIDVIIQFLINESILNDPRLAAGRGNILMHAKIFLEENYSSTLRTLLGGGPGFSGFVADNMNQVKQYRHLHNEFLTVLVDYGVVGCFGFLFMFYQFSKISKFAFTLICLQVIFSLSEGAVFRYPYFLYLHIAIVAMQFSIDSREKMTLSRHPSPRV